MSRLTERQINKMIQDVRNHDPNKIAGYAVFPKTNYSDANDMYFQLQEGYNRCIKELKDLKILNLVLITSSKTSNPLGSLEWFLTLKYWMLCLFTLFVELIQTLLTTLKSR